MKSEVIHRRGTELTEFAQSELTGRILKAAFEVHTVLGPGNFNVASLKLGIKRVINTLRNSANSVPLR